MANITIETKVWNDPRFKILASKIRKSKFDAIARVAALWEYCTEHEKYELSGAEIDAISELKNFGPAIASSDVNLAEQNGDHFYISGTKNRIEWLKKLRLSSKNGGLARVKKASRRLNGRFKAKRNRKPASRLENAWPTPGPGDQPQASVLTSITTSLSAAPSGGSSARIHPPTPQGFFGSIMKSIPVDSKTFAEKKAEAQRQIEELKNREILKSAESDGPPLKGSTDPLIAGVEK